MPQSDLTQTERVIAHLRRQGIARLSELKSLGVTAASVSRMVAAGSIIRLSRGLYQLPDATIDSHQSLAEATKRVPRGVVCLTSALAFHDLTDHVPARVWLAIGQKAWRPTVDYPPIEFVYLSPQQISDGVEIHSIGQVDVPIFNPVKTIVDLFRYRRRLGLNVALEGMREALRQERCTPAEIAGQARKSRVWKHLQPYLEAMTSSG